MESDEICQTFVGSIGYMSIERLLGQQYSYNSDIWSLGVTIFTCATGWNPFLDPGKESGEFWSVLKNIQDHPIPELPKTGPQPTLRKPCSLAE